MAVEFYRLGEKLRLSTHLRDQFSRASASVVLNLAEGSGRMLAADRRRFYRIAFGSLRECEAILDLAKPTGESQKTKEAANHLAASLFKLCKSLETPEPSARFRQPSAPIPENQESKPKAAKT